MSGSGSISQRHGSADPDPDPHLNVIDPLHCSACEGDGERRGPDGAEAVAEPGEDPGEEAEAGAG